MAHYKLRKETERTIIKLVAATFFIYIGVVCFLIFRSQNQTSPKHNPRKPWAATSQEISEITNPEPNTNNDGPLPITNNDNSDSQAYINIMSFKKPDLEILKMGLPEYIHLNSLSTSTECQSALNNMIELKQQLFNSKESTLFTSTIWFSKYWLGYTEWLNNCLGPLTINEKLHFENEVDTLKDKIIILINQDMFGGLINQLDKLNEFIYIDKETHFKNSIEVLYEIEIKLYNTYTEGSLSVAIEFMAALKDVYDKSYGKDEIVYDEKSIAPMGPNTALLNLLGGFKRRVCKFPVIILTQLYTHLYDIAILDKDNSSFSVKIRDTHEDEKLREFLRMYMPYMEVDVKLLVVILEKVKYMKDSRAKMDDTAKVVFHGDLMKEITDLFNKTIKQFNEIYEKIN